ncbi:hypothetical protein GPECTOR_6g825 [Gonium pectorale]|uniref:PsbP C-terminal domain-containing protein n=1 Tax=Gonium pectorale TaxID=33097 RepID=A0A150GVJ2_GONPE|nr:hypothetical protein GPECTOR_6g825 [Gonium pectorale]|eukprot:KXZ53907.1 hypothetical protein GPECTOR_6g825 [Gonium pectorale]
MARPSSGKPQADVSDEQVLGRRQALASQLLLVAGALSPALPAVATEVAESAVGAGQMKTLSDPILAYSFDYPVTTTKGKQLSMLLSRAPEKYSSAAPLTADARQRIVSEIFDFKNFVTASMTVGPASGILKGRSPEEWKPREVALTVLIDKSTARTTAGQRVALNDVQEAHLDARNGLQYWVYEHVSQGSPTITTRSRESYRHSLAVTSWRAGLDGSPYLYTLNLSCPEDLWPELEPLFKRSVEAFTLLPTTRDYIPPDKDPWLFF